MPKKPLPHAKKGRKQYDPNVNITDEDRKNKTHVCEYCGKLVSLPHLALHLKSQMCQNAKAAFNEKNNDNVISGINFTFKNEDTNYPNNNNKYNYDKENKENKEISGFINNQANSNSNNRNNLKNNSFSKENKDKMK